MAQALQFNGLRWREGSVFIYRLTLFSVVRGLPVVAKDWKRFLIVNPTGKRMMGYRLPRFNELLSGSVDYLEEAKQ